MPGQDKTGPIGQGPMTGRGLGPCCARFGLRRGFGRGFGLGTQMVQPIALSKEQEKKILEAELAELEAEKKELETALRKIK